MANSQQTEEKRESLWTLAAALGFMVGVLGVAMALDHSGLRLGKPARGSTVHDPSFQTALTNFDYEMTRPRPELFGNFSDGDVRIRAEISQADTEGDDAGKHAIETGPEPRVVEPYQSLGAGADACGEFARARRTGKQLGTVDTV